MEQVIVDYLKHLDIPISEAYCKKVILSHPDYPSLLSVSDLLEQLGVPCQIGKIEEKHLSKVEFPFLLHLDTAKDGLVLIKDLKDLSKDHIDLKEWKGIVLKAESVEELKDSDHNKQYNKERITKNAALALAISIFAAFYDTHLSFILLDQPDTSYYKHLGSKHWVYSDSQGFGYYL